jgi:hypothetical protein
MRVTSDAASIDAALAKENGAMQQIRGWLRGLFVREAITSRAALIGFLDRNAAFVAQKCATDYCRGKAGAMSQPLFKEKVFVDALTICRWESYVAVLADMMLIVETHLHAPARAVGLEAALKPALFEIFRETLTANPVPNHRTQGWDDAIAAFRLRQATFDASSTIPPTEIGMPAARRMFETLPIHTNMRQFDQEIVFGAVQFHMVGFAQRLGEALQAEPLLRDMTSATD